MVTKGNDVIIVGIISTKQLDLSFKNKDYVRVINNHLKCSQITKNSLTINVCKAVKFIRINVKSKNN